MAQYDREWDDLDAHDYLAEQEALDEHDPDLCYAYGCPLGICCE